MTLALGLTERCAMAGRGKVFYLASDWDFNLKQIPQSKWTREAVKMPCLLYANFAWDQALRDKWFATPHWQRLDRLSALATGLHYTSPVMPITLNWEKENYPNVRITEGIPGAVNLSLNGSGFAYLGFASDISATAGVNWYNAPTAQSGGRTRISFWQGDVAAFAPFRMNDGDALVAELHRMYRLARPETMRSFQRILDLSIEVHDAWAQAGGYCIEDDKDLGPELAAKVRTVAQQLQLAAGTGSRLDRLRQATAQWGPFDQLALRGYQAAARQGVVAVSRFMLRNEEWLDLDLDMRDLVIEMWELEQEGGGTTADGNDNNADADVDADANPGAAAGVAGTAGTVPGPTFTGGSLTRVAGRRGSAATARASTATTSDRASGAASSRGSNRGTSRGSTRGRGPRGAARGGTSRGRVADNDDEVEEQDAEEQADEAQMDDDSDVDVADANRGLAASRTARSSRRTATYAEIGESDDGDMEE